MKRPCVYILSSAPLGTLYIGVTSNLSIRVSQHKLYLIEGFTKQYRVHRLVYYEFHTTMPDAIAREKHLKFWLRSWKIDLIERMNPEWSDLHDENCGAILDGPADIARKSGNEPDFW